MDVVIQSQGDVGEEVLLVLDWLDEMTDEGHDLDRLMQAMCEAVATIAQAEGVALNVH